MICEQSVLAIIPARGGSKGIPQKNIKILHGKPLIAWTIEEAKKSKYIDRLILSSEDPSIMAIAAEYGCEVPFVRPAELSEDTTDTLSVIKHAVSIMGHYNYIVILQPTSPLRSVEDIDKCIEYCTISDVDSCVSVTIPDKNPYWMYFANNNGYLSPFIKNEFCRRQDLPEIFALNGAVYVMKMDSLLSANKIITDKTKYLKMPADRSIDIDSLAEFEIAEFLLRKKHIQKFSE